MTVLIIKNRFGFGSVFTQKRAYRFFIFVVVTCDDTAIQVFTQVVSTRVSVHLIWARKLIALPSGGRVMRLCAPSHRDSVASKEGSGLSE